MFFKNARIYQFVRPLEQSAEQVEELLREFAFSPCGPQDASRSGWVPPLGERSSALTFVANNCLLLCLRTQERVLPAAVINEALAAKIKEVETEQGRTVGRKERRDLKQELTFELMPKAMTRSTPLRAYIDFALNHIVVDAASMTKAENLLSVLRESLGSLPVVPLAGKSHHETVMTNWLKTNSKPRFDVGGDCELQDQSEKQSVIRCKNQDLSTEEILNHIDAGMMVTKLSLAHSDAMEFTVNDELALSRIKFKDVVHEKVEGENAQDATEHYAASFQIMTGEFRLMLRLLLEVFGGQAEPV